MNDTLKYKEIKVNKNASVNGSVETPTNDLIYIPAEVEKRKRAKTLFITDMPFTANLAAKEVPFIGYRGLHNQFHDNLYNLHNDLEEYIKSRKIEEVVLFYNADLMHPKFVPGNDVDLAKKFDSIYQVIKIFKNLLFDLDQDIELWFCHLKHSLMKAEDIITVDEFFKFEKNAGNHLKKLLKNKTSKYFDKINITQTSPNRVYSHLKLDKIETFYGYHTDLLDNKEFVFKHVRYYHNGDKLEKIQYQEAQLYVRVGVSYYKRIMVLNIRGEYEEILEGWNIGTIRLDHGSDFIEQIKCYDRFINIPDNTLSYQKVINTSHNGISSALFNIYNKVDHQPAAGEWPLIERFLKHIFSSANVDAEVLYEFGLDWIQICYTLPTERLPILCPVSAKRGTGKSTFLNLLKAIFQGNATILDNERFKGRFSKHYAGKLIVTLDETEVDLKNNELKERVKNMSTGQVSWMEGKGKDAAEVDNFSKLIMCSNNERDFMRIDEEENRFAVLKIPTLLSAGFEDDPKLLDKMRKEIPAFLNFLLNRKLHYPNKSRMWFGEEVYLTSALVDVVDHTKSRLEKELTELITDMFMSVGKPELKFQLKDIFNALKKSANYGFDSTKIKDYLKFNKNMKPQPLPSHHNTYLLEENGEVREIQKKGRFYTFYYKHWVSTDLIKQFEAEILKP